jgi:hypothetical protein
MIHQAIYNLYPNVTGISGSENPSAYDSNRGLVVIDMNAVNQEVERLEAEAIAQAEAKAQLRTSVINKIATNLTSEEKAWLEENL